MGFILGPTKLLNFLNQSSKMRSRGAESRWQCRKTQSSHLPTTRVPDRSWWGTLTPKEMGGTPKRPGRMLQGPRGEKWRPDRTGAPEGWLGGERGSHTWGDPWGLRSGGSSPSVYPGHSAREGCPVLRRSPTSSEAPSGPHGSWGCRREARGEQERQAGGAAEA